MSGNKNKLKKELNALDIFVLATGTTLSAGFFLLPGIAASQAGPAIVIAYVITAIPLIPAAFSIVELTTAMPRAGGIYYFLDRSMGPLIGTIGGIGTWLALILKVSFALIGMGVYISLFFPKVPISTIAVILAIVVGIINILGARSSASLQTLLVFALLIILSLFIFGGTPQIEASHFKGFFDSGYSSIVSTAGLVYISYVGITNVASLSEEVKNPERNLPIGIFSSLIVTILIYGLGTLVMVGIVPMNELAGDLTPVATTAKYLFGKYGVIVVSIAALFAFVSVANAGTMSASRYPLAMSRDKMMPGFFKYLSSRGTPVISIIVTVGIIIIILVFLDTTKIAKLASAFQLLMFMFVCIAVIVMRESKIDSYDPGYKSPLYPWMQIGGVISTLWLLSYMGWVTKLFSFVLILFCIVWYKVYVKKKVERGGAIYHFFEQLGQHRHEGLDRELRGILKEKGLRKDDPFDQLVANSDVIDLKGRHEFDNVVYSASDLISNKFGHPKELISNEILQGTRVGATPVTNDVALPHIRLEAAEEMYLIMVRSEGGIKIKFNNPATDSEEEQIIHAIFFLVSPESNPSQHLRILAQIAGRVDDQKFLEDWKAARDEQELKEALLHDERFLSIEIRQGSNGSILIGKSLRELHMPEGSLIALIRRDEDIIVPGGSTVIQDKDRITVIGEPKAMDEFHKRYVYKDDN